MYVSKENEWIAKYNDKICPRIVDKLNNIKHNALDFEPFSTRRGIWEISGDTKTFVIDLNSHTCTCKEWDIKGIPCAQAVCAILTDHKDPKVFVNPYYSVQQYKMAYNHIIYPHVSSCVSVNNSQYDEIIMLPPFKRRHGRPKKVKKQKRSR